MGRRYVDVYGDIEVFEPMMKGKPVKKVRIEDITYEGVELLDILCIKSPIITHSIYKHIPYYLIHKSPTGGINSLIQGVSNDSLLI